MSLLNGAYTLTNKKFPNSKLDLFDNTALSPITGANVPKPQRWLVTNVANGQIHVQNGTVATSYVSVPEQESENVGLVGSANPRPWVAVPVPGEEDTFYFKTVRTGLIWTLAGGGDFAVVVLKTARAEIPDAAKWKATLAKSLPDGTYTFTNVKYGSKAGLLGEAALGPNVGLKDTTQKWKVTNVDNDQITLLNSITASYAYVTEVSEYIAITGSRTNFKWIAEVLIGSPGVYYFMDVDRRFVWTLISDNEYAVIVLRPKSGDTPPPEAQWRVASA